MSDDTATLGALMALTCQEPQMWRVIGKGMPGEPDYLGVVVRVPGQANPIVTYITRGVVTQQVGLRLPIEIAAFLGCALDDLFTRDLDAEKMLVMAQPPSKISRLH